MIIVEVSLEGIILILIFLCGNTLCCLAQWTIHMSKTLRDSFGVLCKYQMFADISMLLLTTSYSMIPIEMAPPPEAFFSYWITSIAEVFYFFSGEMHVLFALHRFIFIVFPMMKQGWRSSTPLVLCFCLLVAIFRTFIMTALDANLYWVYDRKQSIWFMSNSEWTEFYEIYFEVFWSVLEIVLILVLDCVTFSRLLSKKSKVAKLFDEGIAVDRRVEKRLILQSLCQCIPTTTVICIYFFVFPLVKDPFLMFLCTSFIWNIGNLLDATIIMFFHLPKALANRKKKSTVVVTTVTSSSAISGA